MTDPVEAAITAYNKCLPLDYDPADDEAMRAAIDAYRDAEIEALRAQVEALENGSESTISGCVVIGAGRFDQLRQTEAKLTDCQSVLKSRGHAEDCPRAQGQIGLIVGDMVFNASPCSDACGYERTLGGEG